MGNRFTSAFAGLVAVLVSCSLAMAQAGQSRAQGNEARSPWKYYPRDTAVGDGGPAPKRDLTGTWAGPGSSPAIPRGAPPEKPALTPLGQQLMSQNKPIGKYGPAGTNDPHARHCDPFGFPQNMYNEGRALSIATMPDRIALIAGALTMGGPLFAHHGDAAYVSSPTVLKDAVVTEYDWMNPHSLIKVDYKDDGGKVQHWTMEIGSTPSMTLLGWSRTTLKPGDVVTIYVFQTKNGLTVGRLNKLVLPDGTVLGDRDASTPSRYGAAEKK